MSAALDAPATPHDAVDMTLTDLPTPVPQEAFRQQGAFLYLAQFLPAHVTAQLIAGTRAVWGMVNRNYLPGHKQGGSVSRHVIDQLAPAIALATRLLRQGRTGAREPPGDHRKRHHRQQQQGHKRHDDL